MRSNGLTAAAYTPVADLDPRVADALLEKLKAQGVAAYTKPVESSSTPGFSRPEFRIDVKDRLYVDTAAAADVRDLISQQDPGLVADNDDLTWAQIVAGFDQPVDPAAARWPADEDVDETGDREPGADDWSSEPVQLDLPLPDVGATAAKVRTPHDEDRFVPEPPPPLPQLDPYKQVAWVGVIGGPLLLLISAMFSVVLPGWLSVLAVGGFVGGFVTLVMTMGNGDDGDGGSDDGAVV